MLNPTDLLAAQRLIRRVPVGESVVEGILDLVRSGRPETSELEEVADHVAWGPGPRASQALMMAARARAVLDGRLSPSLDDVLALAKPVLRHRMALNFAARADGITLDDVIDRCAHRCGNGNGAGPIGKPDLAGNALRAQHRSEALAARLPPLLVAAERVAATVAQGFHGRRRVGTGETFWQYRRYEVGDSATMIDWRQSGKPSRSSSARTSGRRRKASGSGTTRRPRWRTARSRACRPRRSGRSCF